MFPQQLQKEDYRFILLKPKSKIPFENDWQNTNNYRYDDNKLIQHINNGGNYGVVGGFGQLRILDIDDKELAEQIKQQLNTFTVRTGTGGLHFYLISSYENNHVLIQKKGELRAKAYQVVGASSTHPNGNKYTIEVNEEIEHLSRDDIFKLIKQYMRKEITNTKEDIQRDDTRSAKEYRKVISLIKKEWTKKKIFDEMNMFAKWSSAPQQYRELTYNKALDWIDKQGLIKKQKLDEEFNFDEASDSFRRLNQAKVFVKKQPLFYDKAGMWWIWNFEKFCYATSDDVDILNGITKNMSIDTTNSKIKNEMLSALKQIGRNCTPKAPGKSWVQYKDKIVDVKTGEEFESTPGYFITNPIPWSIGESEDTPTMDKLFKEWVVLEGIQDDSYVNTLYEHIAYSTLQDQFLQRLFAYTGSGSNGKGCFLKLVKRFLGEDNIGTTELKLLATKQFESSALYKKQAVFMTEVDAYDMQNTNLLKKLTGEDDIRYEFKGKTPFKEKSGTTSFIASNSLPVTPDKSIAFYRRWSIVDFPHTFDVGKDIIGDIPDIEFMNLSKKCVRICKELYEKPKITNEGSVDARMKRYEERSNPLVKFIEEWCEEKPEAHTIFNQFFIKFNEFLKENRLRLMTKITVSRGLKSEGFQVKGRRTMAEDGSDIQTTCVFGVELGKDQKIGDGIQNTIVVGGKVV